MRQHTSARRAPYLRIGVPAAVLGTLSGALAGHPATAAPTDSVPQTSAAFAMPVAGAPLDRSATASARIVPTEIAPAQYVVQPGDTVSTIASRFGLRTVDVLSWNGLSWRSVIYPGQTLTLAGPAAVAQVTTAPPVTTASSASHVVTAGDTVFGIAQRYGTTVDAVLAANALTRASVIYPGQTLAVPGSAAPAAPAATPAPVPPPAPVASNGPSHVVVAGDTLFAIAQRYGTTTASLFALNGLSAGSIIYPGQSIVVGAAPAVPAAPVAPAAPAAPAASFATLDAEQAANASLIIGIGRQLGVSDRAIALALATAMVESGMRNLTWGDRDSLGLFQQRPSTGWGAPEQIMDADRSTRVFFGGPNDPNGQATRGLLDIPGWESMRFTDAAQAVQISAYPERYGQWETQAYQWLALHG